MAMDINRFRAVIASSCDLRWFQKKKALYWLPLPMNLFMTDSHQIKRGGSSFSCLLWGYCLVSAGIYSLLLMWTDDADES